MSEDYSEAEIERRRDEVVRKMLNTPPAPRKSKKSPPAKGGDPTS
jgi:hypothetical protein